MVLGLSQTYYTFDEYGRKSIPEENASDATSLTFLNIVLSLPHQMYRLCSSRHNVIGLEITVLS